MITVYARRGLHVAGVANLEDPVEVIAGTKRGWNSGLVYKLIDARKYWRGYTLTKIPLTSTRYHPTTREEASGYLFYMIYDPGLYEIISFKVTQLHHTLIAVDEIRDVDVLLSTLLSDISLREFRDLCAEELIRREGVIPKWVRKDKWLNPWKKKQRAIKKKQT